MPIQSNHPGLGSIFASVARWAESCRERFDPARQFEACDAEEVAAIARELMVSPGELMTMTRKGAGAAREVHGLLRALGIDPNRLVDRDAATMRDLQRLCLGCSRKRQCRADLTKGTGAKNYRDYCPNAYTLTLLARQTAAMRTATDAAPSL